MKKSFLAFVLGLVLVFNSCTTMLSPKKQNIEFTTSNEQNELSEGGKEMGKGKVVNYKVSKMTTVHQVDVVAKGHKTSHQVVYPKGRTPAIYPLQIVSAIFFFIPTIVDFGSPVPFVYDKKITLAPSMELPKYEVSGKRIYLDGVYIDEDSISSNSYFVDVKHKKKGNVLAEIEAKNVDKDGKDLKGALMECNLEESNETIYQYLRESGYIDTVNKVFKDNNNTISIEGKLKKYTRYDIDVKGHYPFYKAKGEIVWYIRNNYGEIMDSIIRVDYSDDFIKETPTEIVSDIFQNSYIHLLNSEEFKTKTRTNNDFATKESILNISKPQQLVRNVTDAQEASVVVKTKDGHGSGFAISNNGYILTNYHVVSGEIIGDSNKIWIQQADGGKLKAELVRFNKYRDIALLKVDSTFSKAFQLDNLNGYKVFQEVYTIGAPKYVELPKSYQKGVISNNRSAFGVDYIQVSMAVNGGNSGGPLFDNTGKLHGVIVSKLVGFSTEGVGFAIPSYKVSEYLNIKQ